MFFWFSVLGFANAYNYSNHGIDWPGICNSSLYQSPVDIDSDFVTVVKNGTAQYWYLETNYAPVHVINLNSTSGSVTSGFSFNPSVNFNVLANFGSVFQNEATTSTEYLASSISFHYPAEHTINGQQAKNGSFLLELQILHVSTTNSSNFLALSTFFQPSSQENYFLTQIIDAYYSTIGGDIDCSFATNGWLIIKNFYTYTGSRTTPNCSEGVTWVLFSDYINATQEQISFFASKLNTTSAGGNFRYTFPQNGRIISRHTAGVFSFSAFISFFILFSTV